MKVQTRPPWTVNAGEWRVRYLSPSGERYEATGDAMSTAFLAVLTSVQGRHDWEGADECTRDLAGLYHTVNSVPPPPPMHSRGRFLRWRVWWAARPVWGGQ